MAFTRYLKAENIRIRKELSNKSEVLEFLAGLASAHGVGIEAPLLKEKLLEREQTMSTGIGNGVGVPHTLVEGVEGLHAFVITLREPIDFDSVDRKPVQVVIGLFGNPDRPDLSLGSLATLGRVLRDEAFVHRLWAAETPEDVYGLFAEKEENRIA